MEQHPIPQQISSYQFRLVGDMTLKQFFQLAGGFLVALIFYSAPIPGLVKWPFVIVSAILGIALAFLPLEERPLEKWIFAFFHAIYTPTEFIWKKTASPIKFFQDESAATSPEQDAALKQYLSVSAQKVTPLGKLEGAEQNFLATLTGMFSGLKGGQNTSTQNVQAMPQPEKPKEVQIPETNQIRIPTPGVPHLVVEEKPTQNIPEAQISTQKVAPLVAGEEIISTKQAMFSVDAAPPNPPTIPNVVVGQVVDTDRKIVEGAIMEIRDSMGRPIRALRSNKVGHFITVTPLDTGIYDIITDKDGYEFTPVRFEATGAIIPPILVQGKKLIPAAIPVQNISQAVPVAQTF